MLRRAWTKRALQRCCGLCGACPGCKAVGGCGAQGGILDAGHDGIHDGVGGGYAWARQAEFAVLIGEQRKPIGALTRDMLEAYRWLHGAREELAGTAMKGLWVGWRRGSKSQWRRQEPLLSLAELAEPLRGQGGRLDPVPLVSTPLVASPRAARARLLRLLRRGGLDAPASASLLQRYEGYFPSIEVGVAQILHARLGGDLTWLRWLDLRAMLRDLISAAALWTLPDRGERGWPAGLHLFAS
ncbi:MAG: hypothetical protein H0T76_08000 [Nannocystis sp.]|nr:hypothetical protein [Nannocystis sp.]MBA3546407.1 hypothetical protein [Nannocystis sp.]